MMDWINVKHGLPKEDCECFVMQAEEDYAFRQVWFSVDLGCFVQDKRTGILNRIPEKSITHYCIITKPKKEDL